MSKNKKPILVTGSHRSGSTWIGKIISSSEDVRYVHEPFNIHNKRKDIPLKFWFEYVSEQSSSHYQNEILSFLKSFYSLSAKNLKRRFSEIRSIRDAYHFLHDIRDRSTKRTVLKDPIAIMSCEWIYKKIDCDLIISIRHPAAFVASIKAKNWAFNFNHFLQQEMLLNTHFSEYRDEIEAYSKQTYPIVDQAILLWNIIYSMVITYQEKYKDEWYFVKHEDLSEDPLNEYRELFDYLGLTFTDSVKAQIVKSTINTIETEHERNSKENRFSWKQRLSDLEIQLIKERTAPLWKHFYSEKDWGQ